jgi:hypothetical protein
MKSLSLIVTSLLLASCVVVELSPDGQKVKTITQVVAQSCKYLGLAEAKSENALATEIMIRNRAARMGGNSLLPSSQVSRANYSWYEVVAEIYKCE